MSWQLWSAFFLACWIISISPGAGAIASMSSGVNHGVRLGLWNILGLQLALAAQISIVAAGVGVLLTTTSWAFALIKWFGVFYLLYLAWQQWRAPVRVIQLDARVPNVPAHRLVLRGFLVNMSNPKAMVFLLAVLPQFIDPRAPLAQQYLVMGITMTVVDVIVMSAYTWLAAKILRLMHSAKQQKILNRGFAGLFTLAAGLLSLVHQAGK